ncbi:MAG: ABC transporter substrate-binding protein, partial [Desulfobaccales bacterium]
VGAALLSWEFAAKNLSEREVRGMKRAMVFGFFAVLVASLALGAGPVLAEESFTVGWQPYYIDSYTPAIIQELHLTDKYLPGVKVEYQEGLHTALFAARVLAGRIQVGYGEANPLNIVCSNRAQGEVREVVCTSNSPGQRCALLLTRLDAPDFKTPQDAMQWLDGKIVASPWGSCADKFMRVAMDKGVKPAQYLNQSIEIISTNFKIKKIDAAAVWEPTASRVGTLAGLGIAKLAATGEVCGDRDVGMMMMRGDFIDKHPDLAKGWLKCELEAERFMADPQNWQKAVAMIAKHAVGMPERAIWFGLYGLIPQNVGGVNPKTVMPFVVDAELNNYIHDLYKFQVEHKEVSTATPPANLIDDHLAVEVLKEAGLTSPIGQINALPADQNPFKQ